MKMIQMAAQIFRCKKVTHTKEQAIIGDLICLVRLFFLLLFFFNGLYDGLLWMVLRIFWVKFCHMTCVI